MSSTRRTLFYLTSLSAAVFVIFIVFVLSSEKRMGASRVEQKNVVVPKKDVLNKNIDINISSPSVACRDNFKYTSVPESLVSNLPLSDNRSQQVTSSLSATLSMTNSGIVEYFLNDLKVWKSSEPRVHYTSVETDVLKNFIVDKPLEKWEYCSETTNGIRLHLAPLAISSNFGKRLVWTFLSGWDATAFCTSKICEIPFELSFSKMDKSSPVIISKDRTKRLLLLPNSDLVFLQVGSEKRGSNKFVTEIKGSLIQTYCS